MNLLLDTHTLIWALADNPELSAAAREAIVDGNNFVFVSAVSVWEISIKKALVKLDAPDTLIEETNAIGSRRWKSRWNMVIVQANYHQYI